jgi:hypothetical protein
VAKSHKLTDKAVAKSHKLTDKAVAKSHKLTDKAVECLWKSENPFLDSLCTLFPTFS